MLWSDEVNKARITRRRKEQDEEAGGSCAAAAAAAKLCLLHRAQQSSAVQCSAVVVLESCYCPSVQDHKKASCSINIQRSRERKERKRN
jgi:cobalamin biosynthesis protein CbiD